MMTEVKTKRKTYSIFRHAPMTMMISRAWILMMTGLHNCGLCLKVFVIMDQLARTAPDLNMHKMMWACHVTHAHVLVTWVCQSVRSHIERAME